MSNEPVPSTNMLNPRKTSSGKKFASFSSTTSEPLPPSTSLAIRSNTAAGSDLRTIDRTANSPSFVDWTDRTNPLFTAEQSQCVTSTWTAASAFQFSPALTRASIVPQVILFGLVGILMRVESLTSFPRLKRGDTISPSLKVAIGLPFHDKSTCSTLEDMLFFATHAGASLIPIGTAAPPAIGLFSVTRYSLSVTGGQLSGGGFCCFCCCCRWCCLAREFFGFCGCLGAIVVSVSDGTL